MAPLYTIVCEQLGLKVDASLLSTMQAANATACQTGRAHRRVRGAGGEDGDPREAYEAKSAPTGSDRREGGRVRGAGGDVHENGGDGAAPRPHPRQAACRPLLRRPAACRNLVERQGLDKGGDWERRSRLKVYEALFLLRVRDLKKSSALFLDSIATFTATELLPYNRFIMYAIATSVYALPRKDLQARGHRRRRSCRSSARSASPGSSTGSTSASTAR